MKIGLRYGHSVNCRGASGEIDEVDSCRELYSLVRDLLINQGHTVIDCNSNATTIDGELSEGSSKANANNVDIYITIHLNSATNPNANGVECWTYNTSNSFAISIGNRICSNIASLGTSNRGIKYDTGYHDLRVPYMESIIVETLFCNNESDSNLFRNKKNLIARAIANGIDSRVSFESENTIVEEKKKAMVKGIVIYANDAEVVYAIQLARKLGYVAVWSGTQVDYSVFPQENIWAIGGQRGSYTGYLLDNHFITGANRDETLINFSNVISNL